MLIVLERVADFEPCLAGGRAFIMEVTRDAGKSKKGGLRKKDRRMRH